MLQPSDKRQHFSPCAPRTSNEPFLPQSTAPDEISGGTGFVPSAAAQNASVTETPTDRYGFASMRTSYFLIRFRCMQSR